MSALRVVVDGEPRVQGNHRVSRTGHVYEVRAESLQRWRDLIAWETLRAMRSSARTLAFTGAVAVTLEFRLRAPKRCVRHLPTVSPDVDKLVRPVLDALTAAGAWTDDALVVDLTARKRYGVEPGVTITVHGASEGGTHG